MEFDDERFLTLVFQYPCIYDNHDPNYKNADSREICWADIGNELHCSDVDFLKRKWDISKEKFRRIRKRMIRSDQPSLANEWPLYHVMHNYFDPFIKTRNRLRASDRREMEICHQSELGASHHSENSLLVESKLFVGSHPYVHHELPHSGSAACVDGGGETSSFISPSPASSPEHHSDDNIGEVPLRAPKSKKLKRTSSEGNSSALLCEAMKIWSDSIQQNQRNNAVPISPINSSTDEITLYCLSYAARLKTLPSEAVDDIRCQMESLMREARLKFK